MIKTGNNISDQHLIDFVKQLEEEKWESGSKQQYSKELSGKIALLEEMSVQYKTVFSLFDFEQGIYLFHTQNLFDLIGLDAGKDNLKWDLAYTGIIQDKKGIENFLAIRNKIIQKYPSAILENFQSIACGGTAINLKGNTIRMLYKAKPLLFKGDDVWVSFDSVANIAELMTPQAGYWIRFSFDSKVLYWHSETNEIVDKDIISPREKEAISLWKNRYSIAAIAEKLSVSQFTVKNQLANARKRILARDNTSLVQLYSIMSLQ